MIFLSTAKEEVNVRKMYGEQCTLPKDEFIKKYRVNETGLSSKKANELIHNLGLNEIKQAKPKNGITIFLIVFFHLLIVYY